MIILLSQLEEILGGATIEIITRKETTKRTTKEEKRFHYIISITKPDGQYETFDFFDCIHNYNKEKQWEAKKARGWASYTKKDKEKFMGFSDESILINAMSCIVLDYSSACDMMYADDPIEYMMDEFEYEYKEAKRIAGGLMTGKSKLESIASKEQIKTLIELFEDY